MNRLALGWARMFLYFCRSVVNEIATVSPSPIDQTADTCGARSALTVLNDATSGASMRCRWDSGSVHVFPSGAEVWRCRSVDGAAAGLTSASLSNGVALTRPSGLAAVSAPPPYA